GRAFGGAPWHGRCTVGSRPFIGDQLDAEGSGDVDAEFSAEPQNDLEEGSVEEAHTEDAAEVLKAQL
ncbi:unnamed protein product, partial [Prorocentrum cordatum]